MELKRSQVQFDEDKGGLTDADADDEMDEDTVEEVVLVSDGEERECLEVLFCHLKHS